MTVPDNVYSLIFKRIHNMVIYMVKFRVIWYNLLSNDI